MLYNFRGLWGLYNKYFYFLLNHLGGKKASKLTIYLIKTWINFDCLFSKKPCQFKIMYKEVKTSRQCFIRDANYHHMKCSYLP